MSCWVSVFGDYGETALTSLGLSETDLSWALWNTPPRQNEKVSLKCGVWNELFWFGFELLNKSFENIDQNLYFDRALFSIKLLNKFKQDFFFIWRIPFRDAWSEGIPMISAKWYTMVSLIGSKDYVLFSQRLLTWRTIYWTKKSLWTLFNEKATSVKWKVCLPHSKG